MSQHRPLRTLSLIILRLQQQWHQNHSSTSAMSSSRDGYAWVWSWVAVSLQQQYPRSRTSGLTAKEGSWNFHPSHSKIKRSADLPSFAHLASLWSARLRSVELPPPPLSEPRPPPSLQSPSRRLQFVPPELQFVPSGASVLFLQVLHSH